MRAFLENMLRNIREFFGKLQRKDKIRLGILSVVVIVLAIVVVAMLSRTEYVTMYTAQSAAEAGEILEALQEMDEPYRSDGNKILVPSGRVSELRVRLAAQGVLDSDAFDYTYLYDAAGFNITTDQAKRLETVQTQENIRRQILQIDKIANALVIVNFGEYSPFVVTQGVRDATCSIILVVRNGMTFTNLEAQTIAELVRGGVPGIKYENISIIDSKAVHYPVGDGSVDPYMELDSRFALQNSLQQQIKMQAEQMLSPIYGISNMQINVFVKLNFDRKTTESVEFFPPIPGEEGGIIRSSSELYENSRNPGAAGGVPGTDPNGMGTVEYPYGTLEDGVEYAKAVFERNYEINETRTRIEHEQGIIETLSIGISLNADAVTGDYTTEVTNLVAKGLGIAPGNIAVEHVPYDEGDGSWEKFMEEFEAFQALERRQALMQELIRWAVILLLGLTFMSLLRAILKAIKGEEPEELLLEGAGIDYLADDDFDDVDEFEDVELQTKSTALEQIERFIDKDASAVAQLLRNWLTDE